MLRNAGLNWFLQKGEAVKHERETTDEQGATAVEYGLMVALIAAIVMGTVALLGEAVFGIFQGTLSWPW